MNKITIAKKLFKIANNLDEYGYFEQANKLTKIAADLNEYGEKDYDSDMNYDFEDLDDTVDGTITSLNSDKNFGVMETEDGNRITFRYDSEDKYHVFETEEFDNLQVGYLIKVHLMHKYGEPGVLYIIKRSSEFNKPFGSDFGAMSMEMPESNMSRVDAISRPQDNLYTSRRDFS